MKRDYTTLQVGERIFYTGDIANIEEWCTITDRDDNPRWGLLYALQGDDGGEYPGIPPSNFDGPGRRFVPKAEYDADRAEKIARMRACVAATASANRTG